MRAGRSAYQLIEGNLRRTDSGREGCIKGLKWGENWGNSRGEKGAKRGSVGKDAKDREEK